MVFFFFKPEPFQDMKHFHAFFFLSSYEKFSETKVSQAEPGKYRRITWYLKIKHSIPSGDSEQGSRGSMETLPLGMLRELHLSQGLLCAGWPAGGGVPQPLLTPPRQPHPQWLARLPASQGASMVGFPRAGPFVVLSSDPTAVPGSG